MVFLSDGLGYICYALTHVFAWIAGFFWRLAQHFLDEEFDL